MSQSKSDLSATLERVRANLAHESGYEHAGSDVVLSHLDGNEGFLCTTADIRALLAALARLQEERDAANSCLAMVRSQLADLLGEEKMAATPPMMYDDAVRSVAFLNFVRGSASRDEEASRLRAQLEEAGKDIVHMRENLAFARSSLVGCFSVCPRCNHEDPCDDDDAVVFIDAALRPRPPVGET